MSCGPPLPAVLQQQQPVELGKRRTGLSLFPWPLGAESFSGSSREAELPREDVPLWNVSAPKGLCCLQGGVRSLSSGGKGSLGAFLGYWTVGCISMFLLSLGATLFCWAFLAPTSTMAGTHSLYPGERVRFPPSHMQEKKNQ